MAESMFDDTQVGNYYMVKAYIELCEMVKPVDRKRLAMILEGLIAR